METPPFVRSRVFLLVAGMSIALTFAQSDAQRRVWAWRDAGTNPYASDPWWQVIDVVSPLFFRVVRQSDSVYVLESTSGTFAQMATYAAAAHGMGVQVHPIVQFLENDGEPEMATLLLRGDAKDTLSSQIASVCDTLGFDGVCVDFEYPRAADDSLFTSFLSQLSDNLPEGDSLSVAVPPPNGSYTGAFQFDSLAVDSVSGVAFVLQMNYHRFPVPEDITGPTTPAWWWIDAAEMTRDYQNLPTPFRNGSSSANLKGTSSSLPRPLFLPRHYCVVGNVASLECGGLPPVAPAPLDAGLSPAGAEPQHLRMRQRGRRK